ncbi:epsin-3-like [Macadamia integrifolia]|uniref:epsin-3-like n=1 Tax=Macadamia integrifolia TaxID=60698 RepID=UPI001C4EEAED|nr:epsin-3-like [Macadamia integrifolia]
MGTVSLGDLKKQASFFFQEKYKTVKLALVDVTPAELLAEEATSSDPCSPDAKTMTRIAEAAFDIDDYWRIVDVIHRRLYVADWKQWRQSYKSLVLLDFLLTHGPEDFVEEFQCDKDVIEELGTFIHIDERGFNWGANMQKKSERLLNLLQGGEILKEARYKALKVTKEIKGFGNLMTSPSSSSSSSESSRTSSFGSYTNSTCNESDVPIKSERHPISGNVNEKNTVHGGLPSEKLGTCLTNGKNNVGLHLWDSPIKESGSLVDSEEGNEGPNGFLSGICSRLGVSSPSKYEGSGVIIRSFSDVGKAMKKKIDRQFSLRY